MSGCRMLDLRVQDKEQDASSLLTNWHVLQDLASCNRTIRCIHGQTDSAVDREHESRLAPCRRSSEGRAED